MRAAARNHTTGGNDRDTYGADLSALIEQLDPRDVTLVGFSTGRGEVTRYIGNDGTSRVAQLVLGSAVPPLMVEREDNPGGVPLEVFDGIRAGSLALPWTPCAPPPAGYRRACSVRWCATTSAT